MLFTISYRNSLINENYNKKENIKSQVSAMQKENEQLKVSIENSLNLNSIEKAAEEKLGMRKLDNNQKSICRLTKERLYRASNRRGCNGRRYIVLRKNFNKNIRTI